MSSYSLKDAFPIVARIILTTAGGEDGYVTHQQIVAALLADDEAGKLIEAAAEGSDREAQHIAANMTAWFSQKITMNQSDWSHLFDRKLTPKGYSYRSISPLPYPLLPDVDFAAITFKSKEGELKLVSHLVRERNKGLVSKKLKEAALTGMRCEACDFSAEKSFPGLDSQLCEVHHCIPLAASGPIAVGLQDLALLCPTCHRAIHRTEPMMSVEEFREQYFFTASGSTAST